MVEHETNARWRNVEIQTDCEIDILAMTASIAIKDQVPSLAQPPPPAAIEEPQISPAPTAQPDILVFDSVLRQSAEDESIEKPASPGLKPPYYPEDVYKSAFTHDLEKTMKPSDDETLDPMDTKRRFRKNKRPVDVFGGAPPDSDDGEQQHDTMHFDNQIIGFRKGSVGHRKIKVKPNIMYEKLQPYFEPVNPGA